MPREVKFNVFVFWNAISVRRPALLPEKTVKLVIFNEVPQQQVETFWNQAMKLIQRIRLKDKIDSIADANPFSGSRLYCFPLNVAFNLHNLNGPNNSHWLTRFAFRR